MLSWKWGSLWYKKKQLRKSEMVEMYSLTSEMFILKWRRNKWKMSQATYVGYQLRNKQWFVFMCRIYMECCIADNQAKQDLIYTICSCMNCRGFLLFLLILQSFSFCVLPDPVIRYMFLQNMYRELPLSQPRF